MWECLNVCGVLPWVNHWEASHGKADEVGRKERLLVPVVWTPLGMKEEAQVQPLGSGKVSGFCRGASRPSSDGSRWDASSLQSKSLQKAGWRGWFSIVCSSHCFLDTKMTVFKLLFAWVAMCTLNNLGIGMQSLILNDLSRNRWWRFFKLCKANVLFGNHLLICSDQYFYKNLNLPRMALEAEPPSRPIPLLWFSDLGAQDRPSHWAAARQGRLVRCRASLEWPRQLVVVNSE